MKRALTQLLCGARWCKGGEAWRVGGRPEVMEGETDNLSALSWAPGGYLFLKSLEGLFHTQNLV